MDGKKKIDIRQKLKLEYGFYILMTVLIGLFLYWLFQDEKGTQWNVFFNKTNDYLADYTNVMRYSAYHDPYRNPWNGAAEKGYFPITYLLFYWLAKAVNFVDYRAQGIDVGMFTTNLTIANYVMILMILVMFLQLFQMKKGTSLTKWIMMLVLSMTSVALFSYERGNVIYLAVIGMICFIQGYQSDNPLVKEASFVALAFAAAFKGYPAIFGVLLLFEKRWKEALRLMIYGVLLCIGPFKLIGTGFRYNLSLWLVNLQENGEKYMYTQNPRFGYLYFLSQMKGGDVRDFWYEVLKITFYILAIIGVIVISKQNTWWKKAGMLVSIMILLPTNSGFYCGLYLFPVVILFFNEKEHHWLDILYMISLVVILNPFQLLTEKDVNITLTSANIAMFVFAGLLLVDNTINFVKILIEQMRERREQSVTV